MLDRLLDYAPLISAGMTGVTALIWIVYLNVFLSSYRRQHRPSILITSGAGKGMNAHCFVTNLGLEPVYLIDIILDLTRRDGATVRAVIPERNEHLRDDDHVDLEDARSATNVGPLGSGEEKDIGRFRALIERACAEDPGISPDMPLRCLEITVVTVTASRAELYGASRRYIVEDGDDGRLRLRPTTIKARQLHSALARRRLARELERELGADPEEGGDPTRDRRAAAPP
ncbi:hypothetical protein [Coralloluteibacterium stylophorae]|uniref:Uncharacterized protein n=1 Tax=Coralloluteibacterium stylophorae TaxID=1776034 RepID=A0A8J8AX28_9GAMM|nr:hypothetical protein [Coralloluteibacterium stylophorae]MBS7458841.1 hypothetical protein [Coralloluteibacterium stylophorae]